MPIPSARICTSMCLGRKTACSRNTLGSPKALSASRLASPSAAGSSSGLSTLRIPRPPPPATALTKTGKTKSLAAATKSSTLADWIDDFRTGTPAAIADSFAFTLFPAISSTSAVGPIKVIPLASAALARSGFSERKP